MSQLSFDTSSILASSQRFLPDSGAARSRQDDAESFYEQLQRAQSRPAEQTPAEEPANRDTSDQDERSEPSETDERPADASPATDEGSAPAEGTAVEPEETDDTREEDGPDTAELETAASMQKAPESGQNASAIKSESLPDGASLDGEIAAMQPTTPVDAQPKDGGNADRQLAQLGAGLSGAEDIQAAGAEGESLAPQTEPRAKAAPAEGQTVDEPSSTQGEPPKVPGADILQPADAAAVEQTAAGQAIATGAQPPERRNRPNTAVSDPANSQSEAEPQTSRAVAARRGQQVGAKKEPVSDDGGESPMDATGRGKPSGSEAATLTGVAAAIEQTAPAEEQASDDTTVTTKGSSDSAVGEVRDSRHSQPSHAASQEGSAVNAAASDGSDEVDTADRARFVQRVARAVQSAGERGGSIHLRLSPPELGDLRLAISVHHGVMTAQVETETQAARNLLLDNLPALRDRLAAQDIKIEQFDVGLMDYSREGSPQDTPQQARPEYQPHRAARSGRTDGSEEQLRVSGARAISQPGQGGQLNIVI